MEAATRRFGGPEELLRPNVPKEVRKVADEIERRREFRGERVDEVVVMEGRGVVAGWAISLHVVRGECSYDIRDAKDDLTIMHVFPERGAIAVALGKDRGRTTAVVVYSRA